MRMIEDTKLDFSDVLIIPKSSELTSRSEVSLERSFNLIHAGWEWSGVPIIAANMDTTGTFEMSDALYRHLMLTALHKHYDVSQLVENFKGTNTFYSMGISEKDLDKLNQFIMKMGTPGMVCVDVANGYTQKFLDTIKFLRDKMPNTCIMAGNVVTPEKTEQLIFAGADIVKAGLGNGSVCETRLKAGVGFPQFSAIVDCADAAHGLKGLLCSDGGCTVPGDVAKAFGAGADFVMLGGMLAGTTETTGDIIEKDGKQYKRFYGMSSQYANDQYAGGLDNYRSAEGKEVLVEYRGSVEEIVLDILGGIRSTLTYIGGSELKELPRRATFIKVNNQHNRIFS